MVRSWAAGSAAIDAVRDVEQGEPDAWRAPSTPGWRNWALFGVAIPEEPVAPAAASRTCARWSTRRRPRWCPGRWRRRALATLVVTDADAARGAGVRRAHRGRRAVADLRIADEPGIARAVPSSCWARLADGVLLLAAGERLAGGRRGRRRRHRRAADGHRLLAAAGPRRRSSSAPAAAARLPSQRVVDLAATVLAAEAAGLARWMLDTAGEYAKVREQFGKPIGSFQAIKHMCAEMLLRSEQISVAAADAAAAVAEPARCAAVDRGRGRRRHRHRGRARSTPGTASRCSAASASPGSTTRTCTASRLRHCAVPRRQVALAAARRGADPGRRAPHLRRRPERGGASAPRDRRRRRRGRRAAARTSVRSRWPRPGLHGAALAAALRSRRVAGRAAADRPGAGRRRRGSVRISSSAGGRRRRSSSTARPSRSSGSFRPR